MKSLLSIFFKSNNSFDGQENGERVLYLLRRHPFFIFLQIIILIVLAIVPILFSPFIASFIKSVGWQSITLFLYCVWSIILWLGAFYSLTMYTLDVWIVTDKRIIDSTQKGFFNRTVSELHISKIQDISVETRGIMQTFLKFGDLQIQTAGAEEKFRFLQIPHPEKVKDEIMALLKNLPHH